MAYVFGHGWGEIYWGFIVEEMCVIWLSDDMGGSHGVCVLRKCVQNKDMGWEII